MNKLLSVREPAESLVDYVDSSSASFAIPYGEEFLYEKLPVGARVIYAPPPLEELTDVRQGIRTALNRPLGSDPLFALLRPGMKVTIAMDDLSLPLPAMRTPDVRQLMLEIVLSMLADFGVDDVEIIIAVALHRHMTGPEIKRIVGKRVFSAMYPRQLYNHDAEDQDNLVELGRTKHGEPVVINRRAVESDLLIYLNINLVPMDGGYKSTAVGLTNYRGLSPHHNPSCILESNSYMDPDRSAMNHSWSRMGRVLRDNLKIFTIETTLNNRMFGPGLEFLARPERTWSSIDVLAFKALRRGLTRLPRAARRSLLFSIPAAYGVTGVFAGEPEAVHPSTLESCWKQYSVPVEGQAEIVIYGISFVCPYNVNSIMNPLLVHATACGYFYNFYHGGVPLLKAGGVMIICHPLYDEFHAQHHAPYIEFFHEVLSETRDSQVLREKYEQQFAHNPAYVHMYRHGHAFHGAHPFYMWYWGEAGRRRAGKIIVVGAESARAAKILGWEVADNLTEAIAAARSYLGRSAEVTLLHAPPLLMTKVTDPAVEPFS